MVRYGWPEGVERSEGPRFALVGDEAEETFWGVCADVPEFFDGPPRWPYELIGCEPDGPLAAAALRGGRGGAEAAPLGDVWVVPQADADVPEGSERLDVWQVCDVRVTGWRPHAGGGGLLDITVEAAEGFHEPPDDPYVGAGIRLHDERRWLGRCADLRDVVPAVDDGPEGGRLRLLGVAPEKELRDALALGTRRSLRLGRVYLTALDVRGGGYADHYVNVEVAGRRPSVLGGGLLDLDVVGDSWCGPFPYARAQWERRRGGLPTGVNSWAPYGTRERQAWLDLVRAHGCRLPVRPGPPPGRTYHLDGRYVTDEPGLHLALGEAVNGPGGYFGGCLAALDDCLGGGFGATAPFTLVWEHSDVARRALGRQLSPQGGSYRLYDEAVALLREFQVDVVER
ncbi:barstar family protein [Streptomyces sp. I05A-00742]|uniref:barstar family protein n=1 Tax=Streptomyces sp. I05A-00742 TaxID=2732853 RepID=UPI001489C2FA|nr:barstar family protein [Streptomyces sp. I05A-00742]